MDEQVTAAMARWPDVPAVYGWLSLTESGQWRLHPAGDALRHPRSSGESITSPQILAFIDRNYAADEHGQWYFQNGPQRVYLRLDAAPFIVQTVLDPASGRLRLRTHTGLDIRRLTALYLDEHGRLYAATDRGAALVAGRDIPALLDALTVTGIVEPQAGQDNPATAGAGSGSGTGSSAGSGAGSSAGSGAGAGAGADTIGRSNATPTTEGGAEIEEALARCSEHGATVMLAAPGVEGFPSDPIPLRHAPQASLESTLGFQRRPAPPSAA